MGIRRKVNTTQIVPMKEKTEFNSPLDELIEYQTRSSQEFFGNITKPNGKKESYYQLPKRFSDKLERFPTSVRINVTECMRRLYRNLFSDKWLNESRFISEDGEGAMGGATSAAACNDSAPTVPFSDKKGRTIIITKEQAEWLAEELLKEDSPAEMDTRFGDFGYDAPGLSIGKDDPSMNHSNIMKNSWNDGE